MKQRKILILLFSLNFLNTLLASQKSPQKKIKNPVSSTKPLDTTTNPAGSSATPSLSISPSVGLSALVAASTQLGLPLSQPSTSYTSKKSNPKELAEENITRELAHLEDLIPLFQSITTKSHLNLKSIKEVIDSIEEYKKELQKSTLEEDLHSTQNDDLLNQYIKKLETLINVKRTTLEDHQRKMTTELTEEEERHTQIITSINLKFQKQIEDLSKEYETQIESLQEKIKKIMLQQKTLAETTESIQTLLHEQEKTKKFLINTTNNHLKILNEEIIKLEEQISSHFILDDSCSKKDLYQNLIDTNKKILTDLHLQLNSLISPSKKECDQLTEQDTSDGNTSSLQQDKVVKPTFWNLGLF